MTSPTETQDRLIYVQWSDDGQHIRKWAREPFAGATAFANAGNGAPLGPFDADDHYPVKDLPFALREVAQNIHVQCADHVLEDMVRIVTDAASALEDRTAHSPEGRDFQSEVGDWMLECFGEEIAADKIERADRFIEEALELVQTIPGFTVERARALVEYVFARPVGERGQEVGGVGVTLAALCNTYGLNIRDEWERELARVWTKVEANRAKQATKPVGSALPVAMSPEGRSNGAGEVDPDELTDLIDDAITDSLDIDWTGSIGARAVVDAFRKAGWAVIAKEKPVAE